MKGKKLLTLIGSICLVLVLAVLPFMAACPAPEEKPTTEPIVLKAVGFLPPAHDVTKQWLHFFEMVEERTDGQVVIDYLGGGEVISFLDAPMALLDGKVDIIASGAAFYKSLVPASRALEIGALSLEKGREVGFYDLMREVHKEAGFFFVGYSGVYHGPMFYLWTTKPVTCLDDLKGMKVVTVMDVKDALEKLGMILTPVVSAELYVSLERGVSQAYIGSMTGLIPRSLDEVLTCCIEHPFIGQGMTTVMSVEGWNQIPEDLQDKILEVQSEWEVWAREETLKLNEEHRQKLEAGGMQFVKFSPDEAEEFQSTFYEAIWKELEEDAPEYVDQFREMLGK